MGTVNTYIRQETTYVGKAGKTDIFLNINVILVQSFFYFLILYFTWHNRQFTIVNGHKEFAESIKAFAERGAENAAYICFIYLFIYPFYLRIVSLISFRWLGWCLTAQSTLLHVRSYRDGEFT